MHSVHGVSSEHFEKGFQQKSVQLTAISFQQKLIEILKKSIY
jgi:hypothetical protein